MSTGYRPHPYQHTLGHVWDVNLLDWVVEQQGVVNLGTVVISSTDLATLVGLENRYIMELEYDGSNNPIYIGLAATGSSTGAAVWLIRKLAYDGSNNLLSILYANGAQAFNQIWTGRAGLSYS